ncbi:MAG: hypothetical protein Q8L76_01075 [Cypionkella sp.]|uniref:hypothetical protein n=1 Tax=Cypionkella sp. TaxID=2811411 RepID=UPI0027307A30|nr:hypothetical protein [Cypionkella sp.]MDP1575344.1 hypothetical protein [Cypionkella sp.]MDP2051945.1 hypothetical protein [Cypionkella sp.]
MDDGTGNEMHAEKIRARRKNKLQIVADSQDDGNGREKIEDVFGEVISDDAATFDALLDEVKKLKITVDHIAETLPRVAFKTSKEVNHAENLAIAGVCIGLIVLGVLSPIVFGVTLACGLIGYVLRNRFGY